MIELTLSRYLVKPLFSILLGIGATIGVACLLIVLSLFENYYLSMEKVFMGIHPHIEVHKDKMTLVEADKIIQKLKENFGQQIALLGSAFYGQLNIEIMETEAHKAFCVSEEKDREVCFAEKRQAGEKIKQENIVTRYGFDVVKRDSLQMLLKGISITDNQTVMQVKSIITGSLKLDRLAQNQNSNGAPIPSAFYMEGMPPDKILDDYLLQAVDQNSEPTHFRLIGSLDLGRKKGEIPLLIISLENAWKLLNLEPVVNTIEIKLNEAYKSAELSQQIQDLLGEIYTVENWTNREKASFVFLKVTKLMAFALLFSICIVAAIGVYSTLLLTVMQNKKKIAILKALGIRNLSIYMIFLSSALAIGLIGIIAGTALGYMGSEWLIMEFADNLKNLGLENPQTRISFQDFVTISILTLGLFFLTAIIPARRAVAVDPVDNLQH